MVHLESVDESRNRFRYYGVRVAPNLFGDRSVIVEWGRIGSRGRMRILASGPAADMVRRAEKLVARKQKRGYAVRIDPDAWS